MMRPDRRVALTRHVPRLLLALGLMLLLGGPTPGAVGNCGDKSAPFADLGKYCEDRELLSCERRRLRGEFELSPRDPAMEKAAFDDCLLQATLDCQNRFWAPGCRPTVRQVNACIAALQSYDTLAVEEADLPECKIEALCTVTMLPSDGGMP